MTSEVSPRSISSDIGDTVPLMGRAPAKAALNLSDGEGGKCRGEGFALSRPPSRDRPLTVLPPLEEVPSSGEVEPPGDALGHDPNANLNNCSSLQEGGCEAFLHVATSGVDRQCEGSTEQSFAKLSSQAELIECRMSMLLIEVGQLCGHMDKSIGVLKQLQKQQNRQQAQRRTEQNQQSTQQQPQQPAQTLTQEETQLSQLQTQQQTHEVVASISSKVCSHLDKELAKMLQQHEQHVNQLFELFRASLDDERTQRDMSPPPKLCNEQQMTETVGTKLRAATESPRRSWPETSVAQRAREVQLSGRIGKESSTRNGGDACYLLRNPQNNPVKPLLLGLVDTITEVNRRPSTPVSDSAELGDDGLSRGNPPNAISSPCRAQSTNLWGERVQAALHRAAVERSPGGSPLTSSWRTSPHDGLRSVLHRVTQEHSSSRHSSPASLQPRTNTGAQHSQEVPEGQTIASSPRPLSNGRVGNPVVRSKSGEQIPMSLASRTLARSMMPRVTDVSIHGVPLRRSLGREVAVQDSVTSMQFDGVSNDTSEMHQQERTSLVFNT